MKRLRICYFSLCMAAVAQTQLDLKTQVKDIDFTGAPSTSPIKAGTTLPSACSVDRCIQDQCDCRHQYICVRGNQHLDAIRWQRK